jgi:hypothetical protein
MSDSMVGRWPHHVNAQPAPYGGQESYWYGASWLKGLGRVEDRGCGLGWFRGIMARVDRSCAVIDIDGSGGPTERIIADLAEYITHPPGTPGIFMRHVLEHNERWAEVLDCACRSFTKRMFLVLFTPLCPECDAGPHDLYAGKFGADYLSKGGYIALSFRESDITNVLDSHKLRWQRETILSPGVEFNLEHLFCIERQ